MPKYKLVDWITDTQRVIGSLGFPDGASGKEPTCQCRKHEMWVWFLGQEDSPGEGHSSIIGWRIPGDRGAWQATVHRVAKSQTWLKWLSAASIPYSIPRKEGIKGRKEKRLSSERVNLKSQISCPARESESESEVAQSCPTLFDPIDCSLSGSSLRGILQARILEWVAISFSRGSSGTRDRTWVSSSAGRHFNLWATREAPS